MADAPIRFAVLGDVHGHFTEAAHWLGRAADATGPLDLVVAVGDVQANRDETDVALTHQPRKYRELGDFPKVLAGSVVFPAPVWFVGGNHEPWAALDALGRGEWAPGSTFLGRGGMTEVVGLSLAYLSGIAPPDGAVTDRYRLPAGKGETYFAAEDIEAVRHAARGRLVDVLVTHDWPSGVETMHRGHPLGSDAIRGLDEALRPALHVCGHVHLPRRAAIGPTEFAALDKVGWDQPGCVAVFERRGGAIRELGT